MIARSAADEYGPGIGLVQGTGANIGADIEALTVANNEHEAGKVLLLEYRRTLIQVTKECRDFLVFGRDMLKPVLGRQHSSAYEQLGLTRSLYVPRSPFELQSIVQMYEAFFVANPSMEDAGHDITAARARQLFAALAKARTDVQSQITEVATSLATRNKARTKLRKRLRGVMDEMKQFLDPFDPRWTAFGFNKPGASATPDVPEEVTVELVQPDAAAVEWKPAPRAEYYHLSMKVEGVDEEFVRVGRPKDPNFTIQPLPANATVHVAISAINDGGESEFSQVVTIKTV